MSSVEPQIEEVEFFRFKSLVPDAKARLVNSKFGESKYEKSTCLLACSNQYGYFVAGTLEGFAFGQTKQLRDAIDSAEKGEEVDLTNYTEIKAGDVSMLSLSVDELQLYVGLDGGMFLVYDIYDIANQEEQAQPVSSYQFSSEFNAILPNPVQQDLIAVCLGNNCCQLYLQSSCTIVATLENAKSASWLSEGNEIICGCNDGALVIYDKDGEQKEEFPLNDTVKSVFDEDDQLYASGVFCVSQNEILVAYSSQSDFSHLFLFDKIQFSYIDEIEPGFTDVYPKLNFHFRLLKDFGPNVQYIVTILSASSPDITLIGKQTGGSWMKWDTAAENGIPNMPLDEESMDTYPVGAVIDLTVEKPLPPVDPSVSDVPVPPMPILLFLNNDGLVCAYHMYNHVLAEGNIKFQGMVTSKGMAAVTKPVSKPVSQSAAQLGMNKPPSGFSFASAAKTINNTPSFGTPSAFGTTGGTNAFGSSGFGNSSFGNSGFGGTNFGSTNFGSAAPSAVQTVSLASLSKSTSKDPSAPSPSFGSAPPASTTTTSQNHFFQPASLGTNNNNTLNQTSSSMSNVGMFSSEGAKRTAASPECNGFELGGFSKALATDEADKADEAGGADESDSSDDAISSDEEEEEEEEEEYEDEDETYAKSTRTNLPDPVFAKYEAKEMKPKTYEERVAKQASAKEMEDAYFDTLQAMDEMKIAQYKLHDKTKFLSKTDISARDASCFDQTDYQWRLGDMDGIRDILNEALRETTEVLERDSKTYQMLENINDRDDQVYTTFTHILDVIEEQYKQGGGGGAADKDKALREVAQLANEVMMTPIELHTFNDTIYKQIKDKLESLEPKLVSSKRPTSAPSLYVLRQAIQHIDNKLKECTSTLNRLSKNGTVPTQLMERQSQTLGKLFEDTKRLGLVQKTVAK